MHTLWNFLYWCADVASWLEQDVFAPLADWFNTRGDEAWFVWYERGK